MYAIVRTGGKQYNVSPGDIIQIEKVSAQPGDEITLNEVLLVKNQDVLRVGTPLLEDSAVKATVINHGKAKKVRIFKFKRRKNYRRTMGHRQEFTRVQINDIQTP